MDRGSSNPILRCVRGIIRRRGGGSGVTDRQLLERFLQERDETSFEVLVWRHGPMVLSLGRRVLGNAHDAEDVLQATFLTLVRKGGSIGKSESLASWLYKVAYRIALRARARTAKRKEESRFVEDVPAVERVDEISWRELHPLLDSAIERLPEKYRTAVVLCDLQGKSHREAADQLGCAVGTVSTRVIRARQLLRKRLAHHGLSVSVTALGAALAQQTAAAMPAALTAATVRDALRLASDGSPTSIVSARVAELMEGANRAMLVKRFHLVMFLALAAGAVTVGIASRAALWHKSPTPSGDSPGATAKTPADKPAEAVTVRGRVLDPDGKPVKGARLYWPRVPKEEPKDEDDIEIPLRGKTDDEGRFKIELPRSDIKPDWNLALVSAADGYGVAWAIWSAIEKGGEVTLRLVKDQPIEGRVVTLEGKPVAGVRVTIDTLGAMGEGKVDAFVTAWKRDWRSAMSKMESMYVPLGKILNPTKTDANGYFRITGTGSERLAVLRLRGSSIAQEALYVVNRAGFDAAAVNKAMLDRIPAALRLPGQPPLLYGPKINFVVPASRRIEGIVREAGSGKPVAGFRIGTHVGYGFGIDAVSDKEGRYQLNGVPKVKQYLLSAEPPTGSPWLRSGARLDDTEGVQPLSVDFTVARGIVVSGQVLDKTTGKGVKGGIRFVPLPSNKFADKPGFDSYKYERLTTPLDGDGRFKLRVIPGPGVLLVQAYGNDKVNGQAVNPFRHAEFDAKDRKHVQITETDDGPYFTMLGGSIEFLNIEHAVKVIDLAPDAGTAECNLFVQRGQTMTVKIEDADGKPLKGATVAGLSNGWPGAISIKDATCPVFALDGKKPRRLLLYHAGRKLAGSLTVRGDEKEPPVARLNPTGAVTGRLLDREGQPIAGADISLSSPDGDTRELYRQLDQRKKILHTDKDGRFRIEGIVPDVKFSLNITQGRTFLVGEPRIGARQVKSSATLDLGEVRVKPGP